MWIDDKAATKCKPPQQAFLIQVGALKPPKWKSWGAGLPKSIYLELSPVLIM